MKKEYISPITTLFLMETQLMTTASQLDETKGDQTITTTEEEYNDEFGSRRHNVWDDEEEEEQY